MPRVVDADERRTEIAEAVFALIERGGIEAASLRNVAAEAGLNIGSVRHYIDGHEGLLVVAARHMAHRVAARIEMRIVEAVTAGGGGAVVSVDPDVPGGVVYGRDLAIDLLEQLLPLDAERRREVVVWLAFCERSRVVPALQREARELIEGSRQLSRLLLAEAGVPEGLLDLASESLASAVDGLAIALVHDPERLTRNQIRSILTAQFATAARWKG